MKTNPQTITLGQIADLLGCAVAAEHAGLPVTGLAMLDEAGPTEMSFIGSDAFARQFASTKARAVLVQKKVKLHESSKAIVLIVDDADLAVSKVLKLYAQPVPRPPLGIDPNARIDPSAVLGEDVAVGPFTFIGRNTHIGNRCVIHAGVFISDDVVLASDCEIFPNVTIRERITIGHRVIIHAGSVLGTDGFGYRWDGAKHAKVPQIGTVIIEDDVEIGSCVCIDRAKFSATRVGHGTKIDNLVQIGHNVVIGPHCIIVGQVGLAGSTTVGSGVVIGGQAAVRDHVMIGDRAKIAACSAVADNVPVNAIVSGMPALAHRQSLREQAALRRLPDLVVQVRKLQEQLNRLTENSQPTQPN